MKHRRPVKSATLVLAMVDAASTEAEKAEAKASVEALRSSFLTVLRQNDTNIKESARVLGYELRTFYRLIERLRIWPDIEKIRDERRTAEVLSVDARMAV